MAGDKGAAIPGSALGDQQGLRGCADGSHNGVVDGGAREADAAGLDGGPGLQADPLAARVGVQVDGGLQVDENVLVHDQATFRGTDRCS